MNVTVQVPLCLTVLVDNTSPSADLLAEHGLALLLETDRGVVLFDTGASTHALAANAARLGVSLSGVTFVVLSHGHYDHTGGLPAVLAAAPSARVHYHWRCTVQRWGRRWWVRKPIGMPAESRTALGRLRHVSVGKPQALAEGLLLSGPIPGPAAPAQKGFLADTHSGPRPDTFEDEMFALVRTAPGWVLVTGCCHRGVENTLAHAMTLTGGEPVHAVLGGLHLKDFRPRDLEPVLAALRGAGVREVLCGHCTGEAAQEYLAGHLESRVQPIHVGLRYKA
jgi:7,8-dihydropterin-6-yl-methyl-4-(beta-D-ribofuranosyl)aminobenzene 5'-phosphate synthase